MEPDVTLSLEELSSQKSFRRWRLVRQGLRARFATSRVYFAGKRSCSDGADAVMLWS
jgi:hypothetical protein